MSSVISVTLNVIEHFMQSNKGQLCAFILPLIVSAQTCPPLSRNTFCIHAFFSCKISGGIFAHTACFKYIHNIHNGIRSVLWPICVLSVPKWPYQKTSKQSFHQSFTNFFGLFCLQWKTSTEKTKIYPLFVFVESEKHLLPLYHVSLSFYNVIFLHKCWLKACAVSIIHAN